MEISRKRERERGGGRKMKLSPLLNYRCHELYIFPPSGGNKPLIIERHSVAVHHRDYCSPGLHSFLSSLFCNFLAFSSKNGTERETPSSICSRLQVRSFLLSYVRVVGGKIEFYMRKCGFIILICVVCFTNGNVVFVYPV